MKKSAIALAVFLSAFSLSVAESNGDVCLTTLRILEGAKEMWALENKRTLDDTVRMDQLRPYFYREGWSPRCPDGGVYQVDTVRAPVQCSIHQTIENFVATPKPAPAPAKSWQDIAIDFTIENQVPVFAGVVVLLGLVFGVALYRSAPKTLPGQVGQEAESPSTFIPWLMIVAGSAVAVYFFLGFDTTVAVPGGSAFGIDRVNNLGLMNHRQNGIMLEMGGAILGAILLLVFKRR